MIGSFNLSKNLEPKVISLNPCLCEYIDLTYQCVKKKYFESITIEWRYNLLKNSTSQGNEFMLALQNQQEI